MNSKVALVAAIAIISSLHAYAEGNQPLPSSHLGNLAEVAVAAEKTKLVENVIPQLAAAEVHSLILQELNVRLRSEEREIASHKLEI